MDGSTQEPIAALRARLPASAADRLRSLKLADTVATAVLDVSGLSAAEREGLERDVKAALDGAPGVGEVRVGLTADRPGAPPAPTRTIIAVGSGKGGVGKSTVAANLAVALARAGRKVGVVDADVYGPSQPRLLGTEGITPEARDNRMIAVPSEWGVSVASMGMLVGGGKALAWRGPMAGNAVTQLVEAHWGDAELLIVDLPPGTGDVQLTMLQRFKPAGAVIVSTPQDLALIDAVRAMQLFEQAGVPIIGLIENMAGYVCPHCGGSSDPFGHGGAEAMIGRVDEPFLGRIPLDIAIRRASDAGRPPAAGEGPQGQAFAAIAARLGEWLDARAV